jgi:arginase
LKTSFEEVMIRNLVTKASFRSIVSDKLVSRSTIGLIGIQEDRNSSYQTGPHKAPALIRKHFLEPAVNTWSELGIDVFDSIVDFGDIQPPNSNHSEIFRAVNPYIQEMQETHGLVPLTLGGDHSITFSTCKAVRKFINKPLVIIHFDAHPDIYEDFEGNPDSHASPFARILEVPGLCQQLISIGIRTLSGEQSPQIEKYGVHLIEAKDFPSKGSDIAGALKKFISDKDTPVYITFDIDVLDPVRYTHLLH